MLELDRYPLERLAARVGTPFYLYDAGRLRRNVTRLAALADGPLVACRYAMKANSARPLLEMAREAGLWIDAVSGNEVLRALRAGFPGGCDPPVILLTTDVFRDNALATLLSERILPNLGSPGMLRELLDAGWRGPVGVRVNPGFGHGHVESCDTGGPSSKHGLWPSALREFRRQAADAGSPIVALHAHVGTGSELPRFEAAARQLVEFFVELLPYFPDVAAVNLGGGIPHPYRRGEPEYDLDAFRPFLEEAQRALSRAAGRPLRVEIEPGRYPVAGSAVLVTRVKDVKFTEANDKGPGHTFVMVDAGFCDLVRPAMYGAWHEIEIAGRGPGQVMEPCVVAGPLCESGDLFTRGEEETVEARLMPRPETGELLVLHDAGAYGTAMSSNYVSLGRAPELLWDDGRARLISRRETIDDILGRECDEIV